MATVYQYFERALRRPPAEIFAEPVAADEQRVVFQLQERNGTIVGAAYRATSCVTLVALCERAAETLQGTGVAEVLALTPKQLLAQMPGIPEERRSRAALVVRAVHRAVEQLWRTNA